MRYVIVAASLSVSLVAAGQEVSTAANPPITEAPAAFDNQTNGFVDQATFEEDLEAFEEFETIEDGLGPLYNAQACRECHQNPVSGGGSQITELRAGYLGPNGEFINPEIVIGHGAETISDRSLINDRTICPGPDYPDIEIQQRVPESAPIQTTRLSLSVLGDGFIEAVEDKTFIKLAKQQCKDSGGVICGQVLMVPIVEAPGEIGVGRFGWKNQHASLHSFAADAYFNEMGITSTLFPDEVTELCNTVEVPNDQPDDDGLDDVARFARFMRATKAPPRDAVLAARPAAIRGSQVFDEIGCSTCHVRTLTTARPGTKINGSTFMVPDALGNKQFHPFSDFLLHDVGTGDGIAVVAEEHFGKRLMKLNPNMLAPHTLLSAQNKIRTAPLWGVRLRSRLMHDGASHTFLDAITRHQGEATAVTASFQSLSPEDKRALLQFLKSL